MASSPPKSLTSLVFEYKSRKPIKIIILNHLKLIFPANKVLFWAIVGASTVMFVIVVIFVVRKISIHENNEEDYDDDDQGNVDVVRQREDVSLKT